MTISKFWQYEALYWTILSFKKLSHVSISIIYPRVHSSFPWHFEKMFTATLLALGTRLVKFQISNFGFQACLSLISTQIFNFKHPWAHLMLNCSIFKAKLAKTDIFTKVEKWNFTSLVLRARSVAVNFFSKCHGTDEWTLVFYSVLIF